MTGSVSSENVTMDGAVVYRVDHDGTRMAVLPATCRHGHALAVARYRAREANGILRVRCNACAVAGTADACWTLRSTPPVANVAELDDMPYRDVLPW